MPLEYHLGQRICFKGDHRCTVRYEGSVEGTDKGKVWLGVEWDDPKRGKHNGEYGGRRYFYCIQIKVYYKIIC
jgi:dynactin complex subunit